MKTLIITLILAALVALSNATQYELRDFTPIEPKADQKAKQEAKAIHRNPKKREFRPIPTKPTTKPVKPHYPRPTFK